MSRAGPQPTLDRAALIAVFTLPLLFHAAVVRAFGVNMLIWDEFYYVPFVHLVRTGGDWSQWIFLQHNEHRMVPMKLVLAPIALWTSWNVVAEMYMSIVVVALTAWGLWGIFRGVTDRGPLAFLPAVLFLCNPTQYFNMLTGMQIAFYFTALGLVWSYNFLRKASLKETVLAAACAFLASFSTVPGLIAWPIGLAQLATARASSARLLTWSAAGLTCALLYFHDYQTPPPAVPRKFIGVAPTIHFFLSTVGGPLTPNSYAWSAVIGVAVVLSVLALAARDLRRGELRSASRAAVYALIATAILCAAAITFGRSAIGPAQALESRYVTFTQLAFVGLYFLSLGPRNPRAVTAICGVLLMAGLSGAFVQGIARARAWRANQESLKEILLTYDRQPISALRMLYWPNQLEHYAPYLEHERLVAFADKGRAAR